ncbi:ribosome small subunit-dependent GTPase A [Desulfovibrio sp. JC022]|uniref:ribosome small subunit-dependent GTPase A n=1 Tax=Desulfovibrio sp. JC022 TaxID=2593642 RepID=UPI0013D6C000|nr:ribosome small subunit-dependent GTPase A [Desulfovibrio sp. JC022]NDV23915.1 ribosome small subunit-dependent GTPase A [Desulfovibrio sp. JC022]
MKIFYELAESFSSDTSLKALGWAEFFQENIRDTDVPARVVSVNKDLFLLNQGGKDLQATLSGKVRYNAGLPCSGELFPVTGDWVLIRDSVITRVLPRRNTLSRGAAGGRGKNNDAATEEQIMAANLDTVLIVCGLDRDYNVRRIERYLTLVYNCNLTPAIVLTKADLHEDPLGCVDEVEGVAFGVPVHLVSAEDESGVLELEQYLLPGKTVSMIGSSGAGKSTLLNRLYGESVQQTGAISQSVGKGRHTTTGRDLIRMPQGGMLIDNPGIREIAFYTDDGGMDNAFADIEQFARFCRFSDCDHLNDPGCNVLEAVASGELSAERLESYYKMKRELGYLLQREHKSADRVEKERWRDVALHIKKMKKIRKKG